MRTLLDARTGGSVRATSCSRDRVAGITVITRDSLPASVKGDATGRIVSDNSRVFLTRCHNSETL